MSNAPTLEDPALDDPASRESPAAEAAPTPGADTTRRWRIAAAALLPGVLAGAHLAGLLFFLNPELPFGLVPLLRATLAYGALLGAASLVLHLPVLLRRRPTARFLPWSLAVALLAAGVIDGAQASHYAFYLPSGINTRLLKAGTWLALLGVIVLYTALAHGVTGRRYGRRSRWGIAAAALASLVVMVERREAYQPRPEPTPLGALVEGQRQVRLLVVGIDAATLDVVLPLAEQGGLPFLGEAMARGAYARLRSLTPTRAAPLWTTLGTGKQPFRHGVRSDRLHGAPLLAAGAELRLLPAGIGFSRWGLPAGGARPLPADERQALALWEVLGRLGSTSGVVGWPGGVRPAPGLAFAVGDGFFAGRTEDCWPPAFAAALLGSAPGAPGDSTLDPALLGAFGDPPAALVVRALEQDLWREASLQHLLAERPGTRALFVRLPGLAQASRRWFGGYAAARLEGAQGGRAEAAAAQLERYYRHLDDLLARLWQSTSATTGPRLLAVVSPHGVAAPGPWRRARAFGRLPLSGVPTGEADGVLILQGDGVRPGTFVPDAAVEDVVPTLLYALGLPVGRDMAGTALTGAFEPAFLATHPLGFVPSYERLTR